MLENYPRRAETAETTVQLVLLVTILATAAIYAMIDQQAAGSGVQEKLAVMRHALKIVGTAFLLAVTSTFLRRRMTDPPLAWIWGALLVVAVISWALGCLIFLSAM